MKILDRLKNLTKKTEKEQNHADALAVEFVMAPLPVIKEVSGKDWVYYGEDNLYPQHLRRIVSQSPTQGAIIKGKAGMMAGDGILINGAATVEESKAKVAALPPDVKIRYEEFVANKFGGAPLQEVINKICYDWQKYGAFAMQISWSSDFKSIVGVKHIKVDAIRSGYYENGKVCKYFYSRDWTYYTKSGFEPRPIMAYSETTPMDALVQDAAIDSNQLLYVKNGDLDYYGEPIFSEGMSYVELEGLIANFHLSNITNGYAPSMAITFYTKPSPEEQKVIMKGIAKQYAGTGAAGRGMVFFSDGKELAPTITDIPASGLHQQYIATNDLTVQNILTANQVTSPLLFGISVPGRLGGNAELATAFKIFNRAVIEPDRKKVEATINSLFKVNKIPVEISLLPFNPIA